MFGTRVKDTEARQQLNLMLNELREAEMQISVIMVTLKDDPKYEKAWQDYKDRAFFNARNKPHPLIMPLEE